MAIVINLIIADDHTLFIEGLIQLFKDEKDMRVIDISKNGKELLSIVPKHKADVILMDINMPELNGLDTVRYLKQTHPLLKIIMLSTYNDQHLIEKAKLFGANGYLLKTTNKDELLQTIRIVYNGQDSFPYRQPAIKNQFDSYDNFLKQFNLTKREFQILQLIKQTLTNQQISEKLFLSIYTIETHRKNIMHKLQLNSPAGLMRFINENNI